MADRHAAPAFYGPILLARDFAVTTGFYRSSLKLPVQGGSPFAKCVSAPSSFAIADGRWWARINGSENPIQGESAVSDLVLMVQVEHLEELFQELMVTGTRFLSPPAVREAMGVRMAFLRDPDGRTVALSSPIH